MKMKSILLSVCLLLTACSSQILTHTAISETEVVYYPVISPEVIVIEDGFEIILMDAFIGIDPVSGTLFTFGFKYTGFTEDQIPESRAEYADPPFITALQIFRGEDETSIGLDVYSIGSGTGEGEAGALDIYQSQTYRLPSDFIVGQEERIVVLVTFNELFGISEPVRYELDLVPKQGPLG